MMCKKYILFFLVIFLSRLEAVNNNDSLRKIINTEQNDSLKIIAYNGLFYASINKPSAALQIITEMQRFGENIKNQSHKALCIRKIGTFYHRLNYFDKALEYYFESAKLFTGLNDKAGIANCYNNIANAYASKGELTLNTDYYERAISYHLKCIELRKLTDSAQLSNSYNNIGISYMYNGQYQEALNYYDKALKIYSAVPEGRGGVDMVMMNLGDIYLKMALKEGNKEYFDKSLYYFKNRLDEYRSGGATERHATVLSRIGQILCETGKCREAMKFLNRGFEMSRQIKNKSAIMENALLLSQALERNGEIQKSLDYMKLYNQTKDSLINERNTNSIEQMKTLFDSEQKDKEIQDLSKDNELQQLKVNRQRVVMFGLIGGLLLLIVLGLLLFNRYNIKRRANVELARAYQKIEIKNNQITDSINYAKRIQSSILPRTDFISKHLKNFFIYYQPKDIVSGDFYWFTHINGKSFFAVADCTGHGVPGALMSMIGNTLLNEIVNQKNILDPAEILYRLNEGVTKALRQDGNDILDQEDGMDICVCCVDDNNRKLHYASANISLFCKDKKGLRELKGDIFSVGGGNGQAAKMFQTKTEMLEENTAIIFSTDGFYDQFGGEKNSKYLVANFESFIEKTDFTKGNPDMEFKKELEKWKGYRNQTDDVLVAGFMV